MRIRRPPPRLPARGGLSVGIDLGTTYSAVARVNAEGVPEVLRNRDGENLTPSVVLFDGEQPIAGTMAKRSVVSSPLDVAQFVKRSMGDPHWRFETDGGTAYRAEEISALILKRLKLDAEAVLGEDVTDAVITVPAYFDDSPRRATIDAGTIAGLNVRRVLNEPTAAALAYGLRGDHDGTVLVYDLGGGTFDVTVLWISDGEFRVLATFGDRNLGGFDFDNLLMRLLNERFVAAGGPDLLADESGEAAEAALREQAEIAKHTLSTVDQARVPLAADGCSHTVTVTRAEFEDVTSALLSRTRDIADMVVEEAGLDWSGVSRILPAGGSTRMPMVRRMLADVSGRQPDWTPNPDEIVAHGAAVQAHLLDLPDDDDSPHLGTKSTGIRLKVTDVTSQGLGELLYPKGRDELQNFVIIPKNSPLPAKGSKRWVTRYDRQESATMRITQGDDTNPTYVRLISRTLIPIPAYRIGAPFETTLAYDVDQIVYVELKDLTTGELVGTFEIGGVANMKPEQVEAAIQKLQSIDSA